MSLYQFPWTTAEVSERGYNQAELIAKPLARLLGIPFRSYLVGPHASQAQSFTSNRDVSDGKRYVALMPHVNERRLTSCVFYW